MAWETVKANRGSGGMDGQSLDGFAAQLDEQLDRLHQVSPFGDFDLAHAFAENLSFLLLSVLLLSILWKRYLAQFGETTLWCQ